MQFFVSRPFSTCSLRPFLMVVRKLFSRWSNPTKINTSILHLEITRLFLWLSDDAIFLVLTCYKLKNLPFFGGAIFLLLAVLFFSSKNAMCHCRENDAVISVMLIGLFESEIFLTIKAIRFYINRVALIIFDKPFNKFKITWSNFGRRKTMIFSVTSDILIFQKRCLKDSAGVIRRIFNFQKNWFAWKTILYFIYVHV